MKCFQNVCNNGKLRKNKHSCVVQYAQPLVQIRSILMQMVFPPPCLQRSGWLLPMSRISLEALEKGAVIVRSIWCLPIAIGCVACHSWVAGLNWGPFLHRVWSRPSEVCGG